MIQSTLDSMECQTSSMQIQAELNDSLVHHYSHEKRITSLRRPFNRSGYIVGILSFEGIPVSKFDSQEKKDEKMIPKTLPPPYILFMDFSKNRTIETLLQEKTEDEGIQPKI